MCFTDSSGWKERKDIWALEFPSVSCKREMMNANENKAFCNHGMDMSFGFRGGVFKRYHCDDMEWSLDLSVNRSTDYTADFLLAC